MLVGVHACRHIVCMCVCEREREREREREAERGGWEGGRKGEADEGGNRLSNGSNLCHLQQGSVLASVHHDTPTPPTQQVAQSHSPLLVSTLAYQVTQE